MNHSDFAAVALLKVRSVVGKPEPGQDEPAATMANGTLTGATFLELEPDLAKESGQYSRRIS